MSSRPAATLGTPAGYRRIGGRVNLLVHWRSLTVSGVAFVIILVGAVASLTTGTYPVSLDMLLAIFRGEGEELAAFMVLEQRLPRATGAIVIGGMLGMSGAIFQSVSRNPLGSPDIVGFTRGATTGGLLAILVLASSSTFVTGAGAIIGGAATAAVVVLLTLRRGVGGDTLVLTGIALGQMLASLNDYLLAATDIESAEAAKTWQHGSLNGITWGSVTPLLITAVLLLPVGLWLAGPGRILEMGDDATAGLGLRVRRTRSVMIGYGVVLAAVCVAAAGPIGFLALAAPQLAGRLSNSAGISLLPSFMVGAALLLLADFTAGRLLSPFQIPVGLISSALGGLYLMWLLGMGGRRRA
jgi:ABC-type enterobactin transport system, permease component